MVFRDILGESRFFVKLGEVGIGLVFWDVIECCVYRFCFVFLAGKEGGYVWYEFYFFYFFGFGILG